MMRHIVRLVLPVAALALVTGMLPVIPADIVGSSQLAQVYQGGAGGNMADTSGTSFYEERKNDQEPGGIYFEVEPILPHFTPDLPSYTQPSGSGSQNVTGNDGGATQAGGSGSTVTPPSNSKGSGAGIVTQPYDPGANAKSLIDAWMSGSAVSGGATKIVEVPNIQALIDPLPPIVSDPQLPSGVTTEPVIDRQPTADAGTGQRVTTAPAASVPQVKSALQIWVPAQTTNVVTADTQTVDPVSGQRLQVILLPTTAEAYADQQACGSDCVPFQVAPRIISGEQVFATISGEQVFAETQTGTITELHVTKAGDLIDEIAVKTANNVLGRVDLETQVGVFTVPDARTTALSVVTNGIVNVLRNITSFFDDVFGGKPDSELPSGTTATGGGDECAQRSECGGECTTSSGAAGTCVAGTQSDRRWVGGDTGGYEAVTVPTCGCQEVTGSPVPEPTQGPSCPATTKTGSNAESVTGSGSASQTLTHGTGACEDAYTVCENVAGPQSTYPIISCRTECANKTTQYENGVQFINRVQGEFREMLEAAQKSACESANANAESAAKNKIIACDVSCPNDGKETNCKPCGTELTYSIGACTYTGDDSSDEGAYVTQAKQSGSGDSVKITVNVEAAVEVNYNWTMACGITNSVKDGGSAGSGGTSGGGSTPGTGGSTGAGSGSGADAPASASDSILSLPSKFAAAFRAKVFGTIFGNNDGLPQNPEGADLNITAPRVCQKTITPSVTDPLLELNALYQYLGEKSQSMSADEQARFAAQRIKPTYDNLVKALASAKDFMCGGDPAAQCSGGGQCGPAVLVKRTTASGYLQYSIECCGGSTPDRASDGNVPAGAVPQSTGEQPVAPVVPVTPTEPAPIPVVPTVPPVVGTDKAGSCTRVGNAKLDEQLNLLNQITASITSINQQITQLGNGDYNRGLEVARNQVPSLVTNLNSETQRLEKEKEAVADNIASGALGAVCSTDTKACSAGKCAPSSPTLQNGKYVITCSCNGSAAPASAPTAPTASPDSNDDSQPPVVDAPTAAPVLEPGDTCHDTTFWERLLNWVTGKGSTGECSGSCAKSGGSCSNSAGGGCMCAPLTPPDSSEFPDIPAVNPADPEISDGEEYPPFVSPEPSEPTDLPPLGLDEPFDFPGVIDPGVIGEKVNTCLRYSPENVQRAQEFIDKLVPHDKGNCPSPEQITENGEDAGLTQTQINFLISIEETWGDCGGVSPSAACSKKGLNCTAGICQSTVSGDGCACGSPPPPATQPPVTPDGGSTGGSPATTPQTKSPTTPYREPKSPLQPPSTSLKYPIGCEVKADEMGIVLDRAGNMTWGGVPISEAIKTPEYRNAKNSICTQKKCTSAGGRCGVMPDGKCGCLEQPPVQSSPVVGAGCKCAITIYGRGGEFGNIPAKPGTCTICKNFASTLRSRGIPYTPGLADALDERGRATYNPATAGATCTQLPVVVVDCTKCGGSKSFRCPANETAESIIKSAGY